MGCFVKMPALVGPKLLSTAEPYVVLSQLCYATEGLLTFYNLT